MAGLAGPWGWIVAGLALMALEVLAPGAFMLWLGIAAMAAGLLGFLVPLAWEWSALIFAGLALAAVLIGRQVQRRHKPGDSDFINHRGQALVGREFTLDGPIQNGAGRVKVDDTVWRVAGEDAPAGTRVRVVDCEGATLRVVPVDRAGTP